MKKVLLLSFVFTLLTSFSFGQSIQLMNDEGNVASGSIYNVSGDPGSTLIFDQLYVKNITDSDLFVYGKKIVLTEVAGSMNTFCWNDICYGPNTIVSPEPDSIAPGESATDFAADYFPSGTKGLTSIYYVWFDADNKNDSVYIKVNFNTNQYEQSLQLSDDDGIVPNGYEFTVTGNINEALATEKIYVTNISGEAIDVLAKKTELESVQGASNTFCWASLCYGPDTYVSPDFTTLEPQASAEDFKGEYFPAENAGTSRVQYVFFNRQDESDSVYITVNYIANAPSSIGYVFADAISAPYPNPANEVVYFDIKNTLGYHAEVVIRNLLGAEVKRVRLQNGDHKISVNISDLKSGLYVYSVIANGRILNSNKLVVRH